LKTLDVCQVSPLFDEYSNGPGAPDTNTAALPIPAVAQDAAEVAEVAESGLFEITVTVSKPYT
jgi:hypothetical protein